MEWFLQEENELPGEKLVTLAMYLPKISCRVAWNWTSATNHLTEEERYKQTNLEHFKKENEKWKDIQKIKRSGHRNMSFFVLQ